MIKILILWSKPFYFDLNLLNRIYIFCFRFTPDFVLEKLCVLFYLKELSPRMCFHVHKNFRIQQILNFPCKIFLSEFLLYYNNKYDIYVGKWFKTSAKHERANRGYNITNMYNTSFESLAYTNAIFILVVF